MIWDNALKKALHIDTFVWG